MDEAAKNAERTLAVLSKDYLQSGFAKSEWATAFAQDPTGMAGALLPVRAGQFEQAGLLEQIVYIDLLGRDQTAAEELLLAGA